MVLNGSLQRRVVVFNFKPLRRSSCCLSLIVIALVLTSCGVDSLQGRIILSGSSTLAPLSARAIALWGHDHPQVDARVEAIGTDAGLERLLRYGEAEFAMVSRPLEDRDRAFAREKGKTLLAIPVAWDAICFVVPASNTWATNLSSAQAEQALTSAQLWSDLDPSWPAAPIHRFVMGPNSGTTDLLSQRLLSGQKSRLFTSGAQASEDDQIVARGVANVDGAVGYLGWTAEHSQDKALKILSLDGVLPDPDSIRTQRYALPRQLWLVTFREVLIGQPAARSFVHYLVNHSSELAEAAGLVALSAQERTEVDTLLKDNAIP